MLSTEQKIRRLFHWLALFLAAILLTVGLALMSFDVSDFWHGGREEPPITMGDLFLDAIGLLFACMVLWAAVRALGWAVVRLYGRSETQQHD
jgi:phosphotransferase system  glucose/maltose/N-acetylglucosamine-specific IIC component